MSGPSQPKVEDEQWSDERIAGFLSLKPVDGSNADYHVLIQAYHHMTPEFFARFVKMFVEQGRDLTAESVAGETLLERISEHARASDYIEVLNANAS